MREKILVAVDDFTKEHLFAIQLAVKEWADIIVIPQTTGDAVYIDNLREATVCIGWPKPEWLPGSGLKLLQIGSSGWDAYQAKGLEAKQDFVLCSGKGIYTTGVAEHAIAMMFALVRRIPVHVHDKDNRLFRRHLPYAPEITGAVACVVGMGAIGTEIAKRCKGLGMKVTGVVKANNGKQGLCADRIQELTQLKTAIASADHIFVAIPGLPESEKMFTAEIFAAAKSTAFFYNVSRGTVVDEEALYKCLKEGRLAGAGLDVTAIEPLPAHSKLWELGDNVLITGHSAGLSAEHTNRFCQLVTRNLEKYHRKEKLENRVI